MQPSRVLITAACWLVGVSNAIAASSVDLSVVGVITPSACTPTLSNNGVVDHGKVSFQDFPASGEKELPDARLNLRVDCSGPMLMAVNITDNRAGTATSPYQSGDKSHFGLNVASGGQKIGRYRLQMANATADDQPAELIESWDGNEWMYATNTVWQPGFRRTAKDPSSAAPTPLAMTTFKTDVIVSTTLAHKNYLPMDEEVHVDGSATLEVKYM
ncbi:Protein of unknown function [Pseudomonas antarctica]|uniref:DUF1120 domain-containing protein n=1 Tax=Pseudomonas antarctica TaxID=219572 RepID=A0A1H0DVR1_9PSED|nr:DUF1120 domain-containing protein [Pseudomonas antarctica]KAF2407934.1 hypothetical protein PSAN_03150 [Pseudomonas antarctica]SDN74133.1 Protein of unknown function [Pseudomonas antarctica]